MNQLRPWIKRFFFIQNCLVAKYPVLQQQGLDACLLSSGEEKLGSYCPWLNLGADGKELAFPKQVIAGIGVVISFSGKTQKSRKGILLSPGWAGRKIKRHFSRIFTPCPSPLFAL
jgi:hypothetical protein